MVEGRLLNEITKVIDQRIKTNQDTTQFLANQLVQSSGTNGAGVIIAITESTTTGKVVTVQMNDGSVVEGAPGCSLLCVGLPVTVCGGKVFG